ncbi:MAG: hypothetical protein WKF77_02780 [Planctomycetaceae bacterium]
MAFESLGDVNATPEYAMNNPGEFFQYGDTSWFTNTSTRGTIELWRTDGTQAGTKFVFDTTQAGGGATQIPIAGINGQLLFQAFDPLHGIEIWITDNTPAGAHLLKDLAPGTFDSIVIDSITYKNEVLLQIYDTSLQRSGFFRTDGTAEGTEPLFEDPEELNPATGFYAFQFLRATDDFAYLVLHRQATDDLIRTDGTLEGTQSLGQFTHILATTVFKNQLAFVADQSGTGISLWTSDGSQQGTQEIQLLGSSTPVPPVLTVSGNQLIIEDSAHSKLWTTDLSTSGTVLFFDSWHSQLLRTENFFYYFQYESNGAKKLFRTDLALTGTQEVVMPSEFNALSEYRRYNTSYSYLFQMGRSTYHAFYVLDDQGLRLLDQLPSSDGEIVRFDANRFYDFYRAQYSNDIELAIVDGPASVVRQLGKIQTGTRASDPATAIDGGLGLLFVVGNRPDVVQTISPALWYTDGTHDGTWKLELDGGFIIASRPVKAVQNGTLVYFTTEIFGVGTQLVRLNLTTRRASVVPGIVDVEDFVIARLGDAVFVAPGPAPATPGAFNARSLIRVEPDGTATPVINSQTSGFEVYKVTVLNGQLYLLATTVANGFSLWRSDGTPEGTHLVQSLTSARVDDRSLQLLAGRNQLFMTFGRTTSADPEVWISDGTTEGTLMVHEPISVGSALVSGDHLYFMASTPKQGIELWSSDGTVSGTVSITEPLSPGSNSSTISGIHAIDDGLVFSRNEQLYRTDGTISGTHLLIPQQADDNSSVVFDQVFAMAHTGKDAHFLALDATTGQSTELADENGKSVVPIYTQPLLTMMAESKTGGVVYLGDAGNLGFEPFSIAGPVTPQIPNQPHFHWTPEGDFYGLSWERVWGAVGYEVRLSNNATGNVLESFTSDGRSITTISRSLPVGGYFVELRAIGSDGTPTAWSVRRSFAVGDLPAISALPSETQPAPQTLQIISPETSILTQVWVGDVYTNRRVSLVELPNTGSDPMRVEALLPTTEPTLYAVWVRSLLADNSWTPWTSRQLMSVVLPATEVKSLVPVESARRIDLSWSAVPGASGYEIEIVSTSAGSTNGTIQRLVGSLTNASIALPPDQYSVRIRGLNGRYPLSAWSDLKATFLKAAPQLSRQGSEIVWKPIAGVSGYHVQIKNSKTGAVIMDQVVSSQTLSTGSLPYGPLTVNVSSLYNGTVSDRRTSNTSVEIFRPVVTLGFQYAVTSDATPIATWTAATGAATYEIQILTPSGFLQYRRTGLTSTSHRIDPKLPNGEYRVWIRSWHADGSHSLWGPGTALRIGAPVSVTRSSNIIRWGTANQATHYELWINYDGTSRSKQAKIVHELFLVNTSFTLPQRLPTGKYSVWVRPVRAEASDLYQGQWSSVLSFSL